MRSSALNARLVSVDAAWVCAAERDEAREAKERREALARRISEQIAPKFALEPADARLARELLNLHCDRRAQQKRALHNEARNKLRGLPAANNNNNQQLRSPTPPPSVKAASVYAAENVRLAALLRDRETLLHRPRRKKRRPHIVDDLLALEKRYAMSAARLQKWWRACLRRAFWATYVRKTSASVAIQRVARGMLCRGWVRVWHASRTSGASQIQAAFRGFYVRRVVAAWVRWERVNVCRMQAVVRGHFARTRARRRQQSVAALHIQTLWRGFASRKQSDLLWLAQKAVHLQRLVRGALARKAVRGLRLRAEVAATQLQRMFRGVRARQAVGELLRDRETSNRQELMRVLEVEEEWHRVQREKMAKRLERLQLVDECMESIYLDMQTQRLRVSPRAIEQGWVEEMEGKMKLQRAAITKLKLETVFQLGLELKQKEELLLDFRRRLRDLEERRRNFEIWREEEFLSYWERECLYQHTQRLADRRKKVADQRRRWAITRYHRSGKPDKRWKCGKWAPDVLDAAKKKEVFCLANADLLAIIQSKWKQHVGIDDVSSTIGRVDDLANQVTFVSAQAQMEQVKRLFDPVMDDVEQVSAKAAKIPWPLLDQLASERRKLEEEKTMFKVWKKSHVSLRYSTAGASENSSNRAHL
ncbi:hypothetical protein PybrP1_007757 [[Pythium] brassicae (nom. inval.)]|nr:hypothetical protein PybrP1_007757 [[Pythium] brassicae (nom. inval.)]